LISINHASKPSLLRWFKAGKVPMMPFLQQAVTSFGPEIKNIGAATTGIDRFANKDSLVWIIAFMRFRGL
jgi:hypothetical protein